MRISRFTMLATFSAFVAAQVPSLPPCAKECLSNNLMGCSGVDGTCICNNKALIAALACCVSKSCDAAGIAATIAFSQTICKSFGVTTLPTVATCSSTSAGAMSSTGSASLTMTSSVAESSVASSSMAGSSMAGTNMISSSMTSASAAGGASSASTAAAAPGATNVAGGYGLTAALIAAAMVAGVA